MQWKGYFNGNIILGNSLWKSLSDDACFCSTWAPFQGCWSCVAGGNCMILVWPLGILSSSLDWSCRDVGRFVYLFVCLLVCFWSARSTVCKMFSTSFTSLGPIATNCIPECLIACQSLALSPSLPPDILQVNYLHFYMTSFETYHMLFQDMSAQVGLKKNLCESCHRKINIVAMMLQSDRGWEGKP